MSGLVQIQQAILELPIKERDQLWDWFHEQEECPEFLAATDEGILSIDTKGGIPAEEVRHQIAAWATR